MALSLSMTVTPSPAKSGDKLTLTYVVSGEPTSTTLTSHGHAVIDGLDLPVDNTTVIGNSEQFDAPTSVPAVAWAPTADPRVWTGIAP